MTPHRLAGSRARASWSAVLLLLSVAATALFSSPAAAAPQATNAIVARGAGHVNRVEAAPSVRVIRPNGGEALVQGEQETISWEASTPTVTVFVSRDGGATWQSLGTNLYNVGYSFWKCEGQTTSQALIKVIAIDAQGATAQDVSDGVFTIVSDASRLPTQCSLEVTPPNPVCGDSIALVAQVTPAAATGVVAFTRNGVAIGTAPLDASGQARLALGALAIGTSTFTARYEGDPIYARSYSGTIQFTLNGVVTSSVLTVQPSPSTCGDEVRLDVTVSPPTATGVVAFRDGVSVLGTATLVDGTASITVSSLAAGAHSLSASYSSNGCHLGSVSPQVSHTVEKKTTSATLLVTPAGSSECGSPVRLGVTVSPSTATGNVVFRDGTTTLATVALAGGVAAFETSALPFGNRTLTAVYAGDGCHHGTTSAPVAHTVLRIPTQTVLGAGRLGCGVRLVVDVDPAPGGGLVVFEEEGESIGTVTLNALGHAELVLASVTSGTHVYDARFLGYQCFGTSVADPDTVNTDDNATTTSLVATPSPSSCGAPFTLRAAVSPVGALGDVRFLRDGVEIGVRPLQADGTATLLETPASTGARVYTAAYLGSGCFAASVSPELTHQVVPNPGAVVSITASPNPAKLGDGITVTVGVSPALATGTAEIFEGATSLGVVTLAAAQGQLVVSGLTQGVHSLHAVYSGDACLLAATSVPVQVTIGDPPRLRIEDGRVFEGFSGTRKIFFRLALSSASTVTVSASYRTIDVTALAGSDYVATTGTISIPPGQIETYLPVTTFADTVAEPDEVFEVRLSAPTVAMLEDSVATGTILDDDSGPAPPAGLSSVVRNEGDSGLVPFEFSFVAPVIGPESYHVYTRDEGARVADGDYVALDDTLELLSGQDRATIVVYVRGDSTTEADERFQLVVTNADHGYVGVGTIANDDAQPSLTIEDAAILEGGPGATTALPVTVRMNRASASSVQVDYATRDGTALAANGDYMPASGRMTIPAGARTGTIAVGILGDALVEPSEYFTISISAPAGATIQDGLAGVTILADDAGTPPTVRVLEPNGGEVLTIGTQARVAWTSSDYTMIDVQLSRDGGATWELLGQNLYNVGYAYWKVEGVPTTLARMKVIARDPIGRIAEDQSDSDFTLIEEGGTPPGPMLVGVFEARPLAAAIELRWQLAESPKAEAVTLERRVAGAEEWLAVTAATTEESGVSVVLDTDVEAGVTYAYRLAARFDGGREVRFDAPPVALLAEPPIAAGARIAPNPSRGPIRIDYVLARDGPVRLTVIDVQGREVARLGAGFQAAGPHRVDWDGRCSGGAAPAGIYFLRCEGGDAAFLRRFAIVR